eukprot:scaffold10647_cov113-Isochrysis_galbana.AAC.17
MASKAANVLACTTTSEGVMQHLVFFSRFCIRAWLGVGALRAVAATAAFDVLRFLRRRELRNAGDWRCCCRCRMSYARRCATLNFKRHALCAHAMRRMPFLVSYTVYRRRENVSALARVLDN